MYIDSHCHLENKRFDSDRAEVFARAQERRHRDACLRSATVTVRARARSIAPSSSPSSMTGFTRPSAFIRTKPRCAKQADFDELERLSHDPKVIAWGEIGLDYFYDHSPRDVQQRVFLQQMEMARAAKLPIIIHCRPSDNSENAWDDLLRLIREHWASSGLGGVLHCFTGTVEHAQGRARSWIRRLLRRQHHLSQGAEHSRRRRMVPLDRMFIETDSPYLAPVPHRGKRNEPAFVVRSRATSLNCADFPLRKSACKPHKTSTTFFGLSKSA